MKAAVGVLTAAVPLALTGSVDWPAWLLVWALCFIVGMTLIVWQIADWSRS